MTLVTKWNYSNRYHTSWARGVEGELRLEKGQEASTRRLQEKVQLS